MERADFEKRLKRLEAAVFGDGASEIKPHQGKAIALSQLSRSAHLTNGQKKIALIVGYNEKVSNQPPIGFTQIKESWTGAKFVGKCDPKLLERAIVDGYIRDPETNNRYDLTQQGEDFLEELLKGFENDRK